MLSRSITRSFRSISQVSRKQLSTSSSSASSSNFNRNAVIGLTTLTVAGLTLTSERRRVLNDDKVRESVLDQASLKKPIHRRETGDAAAPSNTEKLQRTTEAVQEKSYELKDKAIELKDEAVAKSQDLKENLQSKVSNIEGKVESKAKDVKDKAETKAKDVKGKAESKARDVKQKVTDEANKASSSISSAADEAANVVEEKSLEAAQPSQGAFNEETGEINWDCPCLGGMADGPCGEQFKEAFSCFIFSEAEPKGVDCVEKFKHMQDCFRAHPEIYGEEIDDDENDTEFVDGPNPADEGVTIKEDIKVPS